MSAPVALSTLVTKVDSNITALNSNPDKGYPYLDKMSYYLLGPEMKLTWSFIEAYNIPDPAFGDFTVSGSTLSSTGQAMLQGQRITVSTDGTLPAPLVEGDIYYVCNSSGDEFELAYTKEAAEQGVIIELTTAGTGTHSYACENDRGSSGSGAYRINLPDGYEIDTTFVNVNEDFQGNKVGTFTAIKYDITGGAKAFDSTVTGYVFAISETELKMKAYDGADMVSVGSDYFKIGETDMQVNYLVECSFPIKNRNYNY